MSTEVPASAVIRGSKWSARFPVYQIDFSAVACGKNVASTKRRIRWRFGYSNREALDTGETGTACRGEEHEISLVWSLTSGKRLIMANGNEVHYSTNISNMFEYTWTMKGNHVIKLVAHAAQLTGNTNFRQYNIFVDGLSFFDMPKVFELGIKGNLTAPFPGVIVKGEVPAPTVAPRGQYYDLTKGEYIKEPTSPEEEEQDLQRAIQASIDESRIHLRKSIPPKGVSPEPLKCPAPTEPRPSEPIPSAPAQQEQDLLDLMGDMTVTNAIVPTNTSSHNYTYDGINLLDNPTPVTGATNNVPYKDPFSHGKQDELLSFGNSPASIEEPSYSPASKRTHIPYSSRIPSDLSYGPSTLAPSNLADLSNAAPPIATLPVDASFAPQPTTILSDNPANLTFAAPPTANSYAPQPTSFPSANLANVSYAAPPTSHSDRLQYDITNAPPSTATAPVSTAPLYEPANQKVEESKNPFDSALQKLVNFDDITSPTDTSFQLSMNSNPFEEQLKKREAISKGAVSSSIPSFSYQPSLSEIRSLRPAPKNETIMQSPPSVPSTTAPQQMVPHVTQNGNFGGYNQHLQSPRCDYPQQIHPMSHNTTDTTGYNSRYYQPSQYQQPQQLYGSQQ